MDIRMEYNKMLELNKYLCDLMYENKIYYINCWKAYEDGVKPLIVYHDQQQQRFINQPEYSKVVFIAYNFYSNRNITLYDHDFAHLRTDTFCGKESYEKIIAFLEMVIEHFQNKEWVKHYNEDAAIRDYLFRCKRSNIPPTQTEPVSFIFNYHNSMKGLNPYWKEYDERYLYECFVRHGTELSRRDAMDVFYGRRKDISMYPYGTPPNERGFFGKLRKLIKRWLS